MEEVFGSIDPGERREDRQVELQGVAGCLFSLVRTLRFCLHGV